MCSMRDTFYSYRIYHSHLINLHHIFKQYIQIRCTLSSWYIYGCISLNAAYHHSMSYTLSRTSNLASSLLLLAFMTKGALSIYTVSHSISCSCTTSTPWHSFLELYQFSYLINPIPSLIFH